MKPKTLDDILDLFSERLGDYILSGGIPNIETLAYREAKSQIIELFKGCVPDEQDGWKHSLEDATEVYGFNTCRSQTLKNMENLK